MLMSKSITVEDVATIYSMLRKMKPFKDWKLPTASQITFIVDPELKFMGTMNMKPYILTIGTKHQEHFVTFVTTIAHEMVHLHLYLEGVPSYNQHRKAFRTKAAEIAELFGFDSKTL